ncbi:MULTISPECIES: glutaredoxin 3 [Inquilinus]|jgi:glutaredoxin 3|uniref:Glutaredoxin n=1 Tax=Inquilinus ginsengisoli TaxID=363840 RepID=A0ABU1JVS4_9PROT|nr:glutaredoxin 3 [Inquilinus ginsengisoli]MDR6292407.1 glutaredoxin 3 [Inquilinus ginsengisoli]
MPDVTVYSSPFCPYCYMAKKLLTQKGVNFEEIDVVAEPSRREEMRQRAGGRNTVPQIFIGATHVGGNDDLQALDRAGRLDPLLAETAPA